jgi:hypothetical protein
MFDLISMAALTAGAALVVFFLSSALSETPRQRTMIAAAFAALFVGVLTAGANRIFSQTAIGTPGLGLGVVGPLVVLAALGLGTERGREAVKRVPMTSLIGIHALRVLGVLFVLLYAEKRLPAPFAPVAGWGDVAVGVMAIPLALMARDAKRVSKGTIFAWNVLGLTDLVVAVSLGATSAPGPLQIFRGGPSSAIMTGLPWLLIPGFLVPLLAFVHLCIFYRLRISAESAEMTQAAMRIATSQVR